MTIDTSADLATYDVCINSGFTYNVFDWVKIPTDCQISVEPLGYTWSVAGTVTRTSENFEIAASVGVAALKVVSDRHDCIKVQSASPVTGPSTAGVFTVTGPLSMGTYSVCMQQASGSWIPIASAGGLHLEVEEKFGEQNFRVFSEMRILAKIRMAILDFVGYVEILTKFSAKLDFRV